MRILFVTQRSLCGHNYAHCALYSGLRSLQRSGFLCEVGCYPIVAPWLHLQPHPLYPNTGLPAEGARDHCQIDTDAAWPQPDGLSDKPDLILGSTHALRELGEAASWSDVPIAVVDGDDVGLNQSAAITDTLRGKPFHYFKRELPAGATWAAPLPFSYPGTRVPAYEAPGATREPAVAYYASHGNHAATARIEIVDRLRALCGDRAWVGLDDDKVKRPTPERTHALMARATVGVHWNPYGASAPWTHGWDGHRFWESVAHGLAVVALRPWIEIPEPFVDGEEVVYVDSPAQLATEAARLVEDPDRARRMGRAAQAKLLRHHTAESRVLWIMRHCGLGSWGPPQCA